MYNRSPRMGKVEYTQTSQLVGPPTYVLDNCTPSKENSAPFLSNTPRNSSFIKKAATEAIYNIRLSQKSSIAASSLKSKAPRFSKHFQDSTPSPTQYNPRKAGGKTERPKGNPGWLYMCRVPYTVSTSAPSVPTKRDQNGYEIVGDKLVKIPPNKYDTSLGPAFYNIESTNLYKQRYGGNRWSASRAKRQTLKVDDGPGPAHYNPKLPDCPMAYYNEEYREMARLFSYIPRYSEAHELKTKRENLPGPAAYESEVKHDEARSKSVKPKPFIIAQKRFTSMMEVTPSPADYEYCDCALLKRDFSTSKEPFGKSCWRFMKKKKLPTPGPGSYELKSPLKEKLESKNNPYSLITPPFSKTAKRVLSFVADDAMYTPSPVDYNLRKWGEKMETERVSVFRSRVPRFPPEKDPKLSPNKYNVREVFNKNKSKVSLNVRDVPFLSTGPRSTFARIKQVTPGPGEYDYNLQMKKQEGFYFKTTPRFEKTPEPAPGPTTYKIHPSIQQSIYKAYATHNLLLKEKTFRKKITLPDASDSYEDWIGMPQTKKKLRCYDGFYTHCKINPY